jgi:hypothetical protein
MPAPRPPARSDDYPLERLERDFPPRPRRFETTVLRSSQVRKGCIQPRAQLFRFREADRLLYAWMMFGRDLSTGVRTKAEAVLSTLEVDSRSERSPVFSWQKSHAPAREASFRQVYA